MSRSSLSLDPSHASVSTFNSHTNKRLDIEFARANNDRSIQSDHDDTISPTTNGRQSSEDRDSDGDSENSEHKARAAAKSNRKVIPTHYVISTELTCFSDCRLGNHE